VAKPIVDGLERDLNGNGKVLRLNLLSEIGKQAAARYDVRSLPTTLLFDGEGTLVHRQTGLPDRDEFLTRLHRPAVQ
jgi:thioredoxin-related protein